MRCSSGRRPRSDSGTAAITGVMWLVAGGSERWLWARGAWLTESGQPSAAADAASAAAAAVLVSGSSWQLRGCRHSAALAFMYLRNVSAGPDILLLGVAVPVSVQKCIVLRKLGAAACPQDTRRQTATPESPAAALAQTIKLAIHWWVHGSRGKCDAGWAVTVCGACGVFP
ncbi:hypothetical protein COO60DRAFT_909311 [Scenedesmus sp. NREL 46B-D3]|nr:hypothetical protein COO60DRAFT_909311 [Scenedesmus sp. NREL 46B-D3]